MDSYLQNTRSLIDLLAYTFGAAFLVVAFIAASFPLAGLVYDRLFKLLKLHQLLMDFIVHRKSFKRWLKLRDQMQQQLDRSH